MTIWSPNIDKTETIAYRAIANALARDIAAGVLVSGDRLPTQRTLAKQCSVTTGTIGRAYALAEEMGLISLEVGRGSFVRGMDGNPDFGDRAHPMINMGMTLPPRGANQVLFSKTLEKLSKRSDLEHLFWAGKAESTTRHRVNAAKWLSQRIACTEQEVLICGGTQSALLMLLSAFAPSGGRLLVESVSFHGILAAAKLLQWELVPVPMDGEGLVPAKLQSIARRGDLLYCTSTFQNPTTATMSQQRRDAVAEVVRKKRLVLIEDDVYGLALDASPLPIASQLDEDAFLISSLSKTFAVGLRLAFVKFPLRYREQLIGALRATNCFLSPLMVEMASMWIENKSVQKIISQNRLRAARRVEMAREILDGQRFACHAHGNHLWLELPHVWSSEALVRAAQESGVVIQSALAFAVNPSEAPNAVRLSLGAPLNETQLREGLIKIKRLLDSGEPTNPSFGY